MGQIVVYLQAQSSVHHLEAFSSYLDLLVPIKESCRLLFGRLFHTKARSLLGLPIYQQSKQLFSLFGVSLLPLVALIFHGLLLFGLRSCSTLVLTSHLVRVVVSMEYHRLGVLMRSRCLFS